MEGGRVEGGVRPQCGVPGWNGEPAAWKTASNWWVIVHVSSPALFLFITMQPANVLIKARAQVGMEHSW